MERWWYAVFGKKSGGVIAGTDLERIVNGNTKKDKSGDRYCIKYVAKYRDNSVLGIFPDYRSAIT